VDSYDVFLLQAQGRRRWRIGPVADASLQPGVPLKILQHFEPTDEWLLEAGDMLYLPPGWGHDGVAEGGDCVTCSIGFRAPRRDELLRELLPRLADAVDDLGPMYRDPAQPATATPGRIPETLANFAVQAVQRGLRDTSVLARALGEMLTEPKPTVWFDAGSALLPGRGLQLDRRTRMMYDARHVYLNGESYRAAGRDAALMRRLADRRRLEAGDWPRLGEQARLLLDEWADAGWLHSEGASDVE
jgi:50S ribosomal protein L16 3-hydroxylase